MSDPFAQEGGLPSVSFGGRDQNNQITSKPVGYKVKLVVTKAPVMVQSRKYGGTELLYWSPNKGGKTTEVNDQPCMSIVLHGKVIADSLGEDVGVEKALWAQKPSNLCTQIGNAKKAAFADNRPIEVGDIIEVELTGFVQGEDKAKAAAKQYEVKIWAADAFASPAPSGPPAQPPGPAGPPAPPAKPVAPVLVDGYDKAAYLATGWTEEGMKAEAKFAPFFAAPAAPAGPAGPPPPPAGPAAPVEDPAAKRAAALAAMSHEDKVALGLA